MDKAPVKQYNQKSDSPRQIQWYRETTDLHKHVFAAVDRAEKGHNTRCLNNSKYLALYENLDMHIPGLLRPLQETFGAKLTFNVIRSVIDTAASKIAANKPRPEFNTTEGDYRLRRQAENLTQFTDGIFYQNKTFSLMQDCFVDAALWGTCAIQVYADGNTIKHERVRVDEILVDDYEGQYRNPPNLYHKRNEFRDNLIQRARNQGWSQEAIAAIESASPAEYADNLDGTADMIAIIESWHLPTRGKDGTLTGGRHCVVIMNHTLLDEPYTCSSFPFVFYRWSNKRIGFYGSGLAEELVPLQHEIGQVLKHISKHNRNTGLKIVVAPGSGINPAHLANTNIPVIEANGIPTPLIFPAVAQETYQYLENLIRKAYELTGINQGQAAATKEKGITSNVALTTINELQTERFMTNSQRYEQFALDIAELTVVLAQNLFTSDNFSIADSANRDLIKQIRWSRIDLDESAYKLQCFPVSAFSTSPTARLQQIQDWMQSGAMPPKRAMQMMGDNPDYREWQSLETASQKRSEKYLDLMKHDGVYNSPDVFMDLDEAVSIAQAEVNRSIIQEVPDNRIQLMRDFIAEAHQLATPPAPPPGAMQGAPLAQPAPLPVSQMLPLQGAQ